MFAKMFKLRHKAQEGSYTVAEIVVKKMKSDTIAETNFTCLPEIVSIMFGEVASEIDKIPLSDNTISRHIQDMSGEIERNIKSTIVCHESLHFNLMRAQTLLVKHNSLYY